MGVDDKSIHVGVLWCNKAKAKEIKVLRIGKQESTLLFFPGPLGDSLEYTDK